MGVSPREEYTLQTLVTHFICEHLDTFVADSNVWSGVHASIRSTLCDRLCDSYSYFPPRAVETLFLVDSDIVESSSIDKAPTLDLSIGAPFLTKLCLPESERHCAFGWSERWFDDLCSAQHSLTHLELCHLPLVRSFSSLYSLIESNRKTLLSIRLCGANCISNAMIENLAYLGPYRCLRTLALIGCSSDCNFSMLQSLRTLHHLKIEDATSFTGDSFREIFLNNINLEIIEILRCPRFSSSGLYLLLSSTFHENLKTIRISQCPEISATSLLYLPAELTIPQQITCLSLSDLPGIDDEDCLLHLISMIGSLEEICLDGCSFGATPAVFRCIATRCKSRLVTARYRSCYSFSDGCLSDLAHFCPSIEVLLLQECELISSSCLLQTIPRFCHLRVLDLSWLETVNDALLISISVSCPSLEEVRLRVARLISDTGLSSLSSLCHLHILDVGRCDSITNEGLCPILLNCSSITFLDVSWCLVDDAFCQKLGSALHKIQNIVIEGCKSITNDGIISLVHSCPLLQRFNCSWNNRISDFVVDDMVAHHPRMIELNVTSCGSISHRYCSDLMVRLPHLEVIR